ncbi:translation initiation factor IF-2 [Spirulina major]|uniref:translation initiation factor IF-2 n=1 Tax=Spirulina major TaxID=270636 RepID=UPI0009331106|nr:translation initiation factor IF-2 [Spirulina major]
MNNGKTRIYELSKELNLENKDIITICETLKIAVKSHSSTITEEEVTQIRAAAQSYQPNPQDQGAIATPAIKKAERGPRKPQIRGIVRHQSESGTLNKPKTPPEATPDDSEAGSDARLISPPSRPSKPASGKTAPSPRRPDRGDKGDSPSPSGGKPKNPAPPPERPSERMASRDNAPSNDDDSSLELLSPPARPRKQKAARTTGNELPSASSPAKPVKPKLPQRDRRSSPAASETAPAAAAPRPKKPDVVQLVKPKAKPESVDLDDQDDDTITPDDAPQKTLLAPPERPQPKPKRPSTRKGKDWDEEDDDADKAKLGKAAKTKTGTKGKRKPLLIEDDDDEFDLDQQGEDDTSTAVSISIARPPKPNQSKSNTPQIMPKGRKPSRPTKDRSESNNRNAAREQQKAAAKPPEVVTLTGSMSMRELSELIKIPETEIIRDLFTKGIAINITQTLDLETSTKVIQELGIEVETPEAKSAATKSEMLDLDDLENLQTRPPVVTIMGHVDHGKTTLLDSIRKTKVAQGEAGGITQHIGAYHVDVEHNGKVQQVVFLDTPGHEAFTAMRARGTKVTDIAILVVAADDGVQPQTREAISHAKAAGVPLIVAINKVDKPDSEPDRIKQELTEQGLVPEEWGGETIMVPVSAIKGDNLDTLLEMILLVSEMEELSANPDRPARGTVIEAHLDKSRGPVATLLIQNGTLRVGDSVVAGATLGKIRAMVDDRGDRVESATPSFAVEVLGMNDVPSAGDEFSIFASEKEARAVADERAAERRENRLQQAMSRRVTLSSLSAQAQEGELKELNLILKADVQGSVEAIAASLEKLPQGEVQIRMLLAAPGEISETDVDLAAASGAVIIGFNTDLASGAASAADREGVDIREYTIIYNLLDDVQAAMEGLLEPEEVEEYLGTVEVRAVFPVGKGSVAGCYVLSGKVIRNRRMRVMRGDQVIHDGIMDSLKRIKEDVREVNAGYECGIGSDKFNDWQEGDRIEAYQMIMKRRTLSMV